MAYIDTEYLFECETCHHCIGEYKCDTFCDSGECYSPNMSKIPTAEVVPKSEVAREIFEEIEKEIDLSLSVIEKILNLKGGRANGKTVLISKYDVFIEAKKYIAELKKKYTEGKYEKN